MFHTLIGDGGSGDLDRAVRRTPLYARGSGKRKIDSSETLMTGHLQLSTLRRANLDAARRSASLAPDASVAARAHLIPTHQVTPAILRALPIFADTPDASLEAVAHVSMLRRVARYAQVVRAGERTDFVYLILSGKLNVLVGDEEGREAILAVLGPGELFGEMGMLDDEARSATVMAVTPSVLVAISKTDFKLCLKENFDVAHYVMRKLIQRLRVANRSIESLALLDVGGRVARVLGDMAETFSGEQVVTCKLAYPVKHHSY